MPLLDALAHVKWSTDGHATITLRPAQSAAKAGAAVLLRRPTLDMLREQQKAGTLIVHPSRGNPLSRGATSLMNDIQKGLGLRWGAAGEWTDAAQQRLENLLAKAKEGRGQAKVQASFG